MIRTEYTIVITDPKGKKTHSVYAKKYAEEKAEKAKEFYEPKGYTVEYFKAQYIGNSFVKAEKIW